MQILSGISLPKSENYVITHFHTEFNSVSSSISRKFRNRLSSVDAVCHIRSRNYDLRFGFLCKYSIVKFSVFGEVGRDSFASLVPLAIGLQGQSVDREVVDDDLNPLDELPVRDEVSVNEVVENASKLLDELPVRDEVSVNEVVEDASKLLDELPVRDEEGHNGVHLGVGYVKRDGEVVTDALNPLDELPVSGAKGLSDVESPVLDNKSEERVEKESGNELEEKKSPLIIDTRALAWSLRLAKTAEDIEVILKDKGELPPKVFTSVIKGLGKDKNVGSAMAILEWLKKKKKENNGVIGPNLFIYNSLLGAMKQNKDHERVGEVVDDMMSDGFTPNIVTYNTLMGIYIDQGREMEALKLFEEIKEKGLSPTPASYSTTLLAYQKLEDGFGAIKFYLDFKEKYQNGEALDGIEDRETEFAKLENYMLKICYQVMRHWLIKKENLSTCVLDFLAERDKTGLQPARTEMERLIWACTRDEHHIVAKELYIRIRNMDPEISLSVCNHVIWVLGKARKWWAALEIYEDLLDKGPKPDNMSYELIASHFNILLSAARRKGIWRWGIRLLNKMEEKGLKPGSKEWNSVLIACSKASETAAAVEVFKRMVERGEKPTIISYGALLSALAKGKLYDKAIQVFKHMKKVGVEPNLHVYTIMVSMETGQGNFEKVESILQEMRRADAEPTIITYNAIISACAHNNMGGPAYEWFHRIKKEEIVEANEITYEMTIEALANDGKPRLAYELYLKARNEGLKLSCKAFDAVIRSSEEYGAKIDESSLGLRPPAPEKVKRAAGRKSSVFCDVPPPEVPRRRKPLESEELYSSLIETN